MKTILLLLLSVVSASADVLVYSGTSTETSPGSKPKATRVFLVYDTEGRKTTLLARSGAFLATRNETILESQTVQNAGGRSFLVLYSSSPLNQLPVVQWQLTSTAQLDLPLAPRTLSGRLSRLQPSTFVVQIIDPITGTTPIPQPPSFSDQKLVLTLDRKRTDRAESEDWSYSEVLIDLIQHAK